MFWFQDDQTNIYSGFFRESEVEKQEDIWLWWILGHRQEET